jgi:nucleotide-binding universal stress UspA family protein
MGALSQDLFTIIVTMAVLTTMAMPPMLRSALARLPLRKAERERLEQEEMEAKGFVPTLERLLLAIDDSPNGKFAARLAGVIAGSKGMPTTVIQLQNGKTPQKPSAATEDESPEATVKSAAEAKPKAQQDESKPVDVTTKVPEKPAEEAVAEEAGKGYDLLVIGLEKTVARKQEFHPDVNRIAGGFDGPLAIVDARNGHLEDPLAEKLRILAPVNGTATARNAAEIAFVIARASKAPVTILYVAARPTAAGKKRRRGIRTRQHEQAILKDIADLADGYGVNARTAVLADIAADEAILKETERGEHNLVVLGAGRRPGEKLFFGDTAAAVLEKSKASLMMVSS